MSEPVRYRVSMSRPHAHLFEVEAAFPATPGELVVALPVWTPGSYLVREYSRHVQEFSVVDEGDQPVPFSRVDKRSYRVEAKGAAVRCRYKVYAHELTVRTSHLDATHGYFNGATLFFYAEALRGRPHHVTIDAPAGWKTTVALEQQGVSWVAKDYDELVDSPFEVGHHEVLRFTAAGVPHEIVTWGEPQLDEQKLTADLAKLVETEAALFGGLPMKRYVFFIYAGDKGRGGLEHQASTALIYPRAGFSSAKGWEDFLTLCAHEYFHLWNVKRVKPRRFVPFDYAQENYTELLWWFEGGTSYYDTLLTRRAGLMSGARFLTRLGESLSVLHGTPGRRVLPLAEASLISWVKHYRPDENTPNTAISYYLKGEIVCALLDLTLRQATGDRKSLDDVARLLWQRYGDESGVPEDGVEAAAAEVAGTPLRDFFQRALRSTEELDYAPFAHVGLEVRFRTRESAGDKGGTPPRGRADKPTGWVGLVPRAGGVVASVLEGSPAMEAGLAPDDEILAVDGHKCDAAGLVSRCDERKPGDTLQVSLFRRERLLQVPLTVGARPLDMAWLAPVEHPTDAQRAAYEAWLGVPWSAE